MARSRSQIDGASFCRLGASLLKQSIEKDPLKPLTPSSQSVNGSMSNSFGEFLDSPRGSKTRKNDPPFQKSEAYKHYQRHISSSSESESDSEPSKRCSNEIRVSDADEQLLQVKQESLLMQEKLRQAEEAIDRLQKMNKTSIIPTISKLESDVALMANSAKKQGSSLQQAQNVIIWIVDNCFMRHATGKIDLSKSSSVLLDLEAGVPPQKQQSTSHVVLLWAQSFLLFASGWHGWPRCS